MKFRKKPVVIDAVKFVPTIDGEAQMKAFLGASLGKIDYHGSKCEAEILTLEDGHDNRVKHIATEGDWIIKGVQGEFYPCKPDIFEATYEAINSV
jgi:hypothetical protein